MHIGILREKRSSLGVRDYPGEFEAPTLRSYVCVCLILLLLEDRRHLKERDELQYVHRRLRANSFVLRVARKVFAVKDLGVHSLIDVV